MTARDQSVIGIDLGGTSVRIGVFTSGYELIDSVSFNTQVERGPAEVVTEMAKSIQSLEHKHGGAIRAIGIGSPGPLDLADGKLLELPNFPGWEGFRLRDELAGATGYNVTLESDANVAALAELMCGAGKEFGVDSLVMWTLGTGVGGGIVLERQIWRGSNDMAGEIGHISVDAQGASCSCGGQGCLELYASATGIRTAGKEWFRQNPSDGACNDTETLTPKIMAKLAEGGHEGMRTLFCEVGFKLGLGVAQAINTLDVPLYIIGGGIASAWHLFSPALLETVEKYSYVYRLGKNSRNKSCPIIAPAMLGPGAGLLGAALIAKQ